MIPAGPDRKRQEAVASLPDRHIARVGMRQRNLHHLPGDECPVLIADLRVLENRFRRVEDAVLRRRDDPAARVRVILVGAATSRDPRLAAFFKQVVDRLPEQFLDVGFFLKSDLLELTRGGGIEESGDGFLATPTGNDGGFRGQRAGCDSGFGNSGLPLACRSASLRLDPLRHVHNPTCRHTHL